MFQAEVIKKNAILCSISLFPPKTVLFIEIILKNVLQPTRLHMTI